MTKNWKNNIKNSICETVFIWVVIKINSIKGKRKKQKVLKNNKNNIKIGEKSNKEVNQ